VNGVDEMEILHEIVAADKAARQRVEAARQEKENPPWGGTQ